MKKLQDPDMVLITDDHGEIAFYAVHQRIQQPGDANMHLSSLITTHRIGLTTLGSHLTIGRVTS